MGLLSGCQKKRINKTAIENGIQKKIKGKLFLILCIANLEAWQLDLCNDSCNKDCTTYLQQVHILVEIGRHYFNSAPKGHLNSEWIYEVIISPNVWTNNLKYFCPWSLLEGRAEILQIFGWHFVRNDEMYFNLRIENDNMLWILVTFINIAAFCHSKFHSIFPFYWLEMQLWQR